MAKKDEIKIKINVDGKDIELTKKQADKLGKSLDKTGTSAHSADRRLKGAAQASSNTTKNFSKMAQGISGGLVPAYATLAANIFAIGAAFRFLQSAADFRILTQGQAEYAQRTGQNLAIMTRNLQAATDGQLAFADAAQSVAIATAAGLSTKQINQLGIVAKNASLMLGRDLTDSFNRLVRGAVKAEPELLDELGIILRLETASEKYALSIDKTKDQLNIFEKSQAVVNEVLEQGLEKFGSVDTATNELTKLAKAFDDLVNNIKNLIGPLAEFMALALSQNTVATAGVGLLAGGSVISALTPKVTPIDAAGAQAGARASMQNMLSEKGMKEFGELDSPKSIAKFEQAMTRKKSSFLNYSTFVKHEGQRMASILKVQESQRELQSAGMFRRMGLNWKITMDMMVAEHGLAMARIKMAGRTLLKGISFLGYLGLFISLTAMAVQFFKESDEAAAASKKAQNEFGNLFEKNAQDLAKMVDGLKTYDSLLTNALVSARALSNIDYSQAQAAFAGGLGAKTAGGVIGRGAIMNFLLKDRLGTVSEKGAMKDTLSPGQLKGMEGIVSTLNSQMRLLVKGGDAHNEMAGIAEGIQRILNAFKDGKGGPKDLEEFMGFLDDLSDGTIASKAMNNLAQTTQIMTSSASDFTKALSSFKNPRTQLSRLTSNIASVGSALSGVGEAFAEGNVKMKIGKDGKGSIFDKATKDMLATFLSDDELAAMKKDEAELNILDLARNEKGGEAKFAEAGGEFIKTYGGLVEAEAKRLHGIEMKMITGKVELETELLDRTMGQSKMRAGQLVKEGKVLELQRQQADIQIMLDELARKKLTKDDAQVKLETEKLNNINMKIRKAKLEASALGQVQQTFRDSFESSMATAFQSIIEGTSNMKDAFLSMTKSILSAIAQILSKQAAIAIMGMIPGMPGIPIGGPGSREGGILSSPGYRSFGTGGVASGPDSGYAATLHGTEAVVPLPNGRSIPVEMSGGTGGNNVTVNVSMATGESSSTGDGADAYELGRAISTAVSNEISKQQRPGGTLSPY
tara:strand:- start:2084 stop:5176 length:3093 start_codon:yes stop_codon:yes gene_type:complete